MRLDPPARPKSARILSAREALDRHFTSEYGYLGAVDDDPVLIEERWLLTADKQSTLCLLIGVLDRENPHAGSRKPATMKWRVRKLVG